MNKIKYIVLIILTIILFGFLFYWFSLKPSFIKQDCYQTAIDRAIEKYQEDNNTYKDRFMYDDYNQAYKMCIEKRGL